MGKETDAPRERGARFRRGCYRFRRARGQVVNDVGATRSQAGIRETGAYRTDGGADTEGGNQRRRVGPPAPIEGPRGCQRQCPAHWQVRPPQARGTDPLGPPGSCRRAMGMASHGDSGCQPEAERSSRRRGGAHCRDCTARLLASGLAGRVVGVRCWLGRVVGVRCWLGPGRSALGARSRPHRSGSAGA
jgi:hypothetical protein